MKQTCENCKFCTCTGNGKRVLCNNGLVMSYMFDLFESQGIFSFARPIVEKDFSCQIWKPKKSRGHRIVERLKTLWAMIALGALGGIFIWSFINIVSELLNRGGAK